jgi:hypothetical protein
MESAVITRDDAKSWLGKGQIDHWHVLGQPDAVRGSIKLQSIMLHLRGIDYQHDRFAMPTTHFDDGGFIDREMHVLSSFRDQALLSNAVEETPRGVVIQPIRWRQWFEIQINRNQVTLTGPNTQPIFAKRITLLVVFGDDLPQQIKREWHSSGALRSADQVIDRCPASDIEREVNDLRFVPQHEADESTEF